MRSNRSVVLASFVWFSAAGLSAQALVDDLRLKRDFREALVGRTEAARQYLVQAVDRPWLADMSFTDACALATKVQQDLPVEAEKLVLATALKNPGLALRESQLYLSMAFGTRVLEKVAMAAPDEAVEVLAGERGSAAQKAMAAAEAPVLHTLVKLAQDRTIDSPTRQRVALLAGPIARGTLTTANAVLLARDPTRYFATLANARLAASGAEVAALDRGLELEARLLCRSAAESGGQSLPRELPGFRATELYLLLAYGRAEAEGLVFATVFDRLLLPKLRAERPAASSLLRFLETSGDLELRGFSAAAAAAHRLDPFLQLVGATTIARLASGLDRTQDPQREAIRLAEVIAATASPTLLSAMAGTALSEYRRCSEQGNANARVLYGLLIARLSQAATATAAVREAGSAYLPFLVSADGLDLTALFGKEQRMIQRYFFYDDGDGVESFESFLNSYRRDSAWTIEDRGEYVEVKGRAASGREIEIYANKPVDSHLPANRGRDFEAERRQDGIARLLEERGVAPSVMVHRGHSFYVSRTVKRIVPSARLVVLGSCGGVTDIAGVIQASHEAQVIATRGVGTADVNDGLLKNLNDRLLNGGASLEWATFWEEQKRKLGSHPMFRDYVAPNREPSAVFLRAYYLLLDAAKP